MNEDNVLVKLAWLREASLTQLRKKWEELFGQEAPYHNRGYIEARLAYRFQELAYGGLPEGTKKRLKKLCAVLNDRTPKKTIIKPPVGTMLLREWRGAEHRVRVLAEGFEYKGKRFNSLTSVATHITGTHWNGPAFFGLRQEKKRA